MGYALTRPSPRRALPRPSTVSRLCAILRAAFGFVMSLSLRKRQGTLPRSGGLFADEKLLCEHSISSAKRSPGQASNQQLCGQNDARPGCAGTSCTKQCRSLKSFRAEFSREERVHGVENRVRIRTRFFAMDALPRNVSVMILSSDLGGDGSLGDHDRPGQT